MPLYEYKCESCEKVYEELVTGDRDRKIPCPACGSGKTHKIMSVIGAIATGSTGRCGDSCANAPSCAMATGGGCPGMCHG